MKKSIPLAVAVAALASACTSMEDVKLAASPRASISLMKVAQSSHEARWFAQQPSVLVALRSLLAHPAISSSVI